MELEPILAIIMFVVAIIALLSGYPVALTLAGVALLFALIGSDWGLGIFESRDLSFFPSRILGIMQNQILTAVPMFVFMGLLLEKSRIAADLLEVSSKVLGRTRGGLGFAVLFVGALLAASTGIVGASVTTMTLIALPTMLKHGYNKPLATGVIAAAGTLGQIIPPSIVLILLADAMSIAASQANAADSSINGIVSVGDLFAGALVPGLLLVIVYGAWLLFVSIKSPEKCPPDPSTKSVELSASAILLSMMTPLLLIVAVLGSILLGVASPTEAAAIGVAGTLIISGLRSTDGFKTWQARILIAAVVAIVMIFILSNNTILWADEHEFLKTTTVVLSILAATTILCGLAISLHKLHSNKFLNSALSETSRICAMVFLLVIGASLFSLVFRGYGGDELIFHLLSIIPGGRWAALIFTLFVMFLLGFFLDFIEIVFIVVPIVAPALIIAGFDPIWLAVVMALVLQTSFLTPPFGFALFYIRGTAPSSVTTEDIWRGAVPFIILQILVVSFVLLFPHVATWLPAKI